MLLQIFKYIYVLFAFLFVFISVLLDQYIWNYEIFLASMYFVLLLPLIDILFNKFKEITLNTNLVKYFGKQNVIKHKKEILAVVFLITNLCISSHNLFKFGFIFYLLLSFLYYVNYRITFLISGILLLCLPIFVLFRRDIVVDHFIVYTSYFLGLGILQFFLSKFRFNFKDKRDKIVNYVVDNHKNIFYFMIILFTICLVGAFYIGFIRGLIIPFLYIIGAFYFFAKLAGFEIEYEKIIQKINFKSFFVISLISCSMFIAFVDTSVINRRRLVVYLLAMSFYFILFLIETNILKVSIKIILSNVFTKFLFSIMLILLLGIGINFKYYRYMQGLQIVKQFEKKQEEVEKTQSKKRQYLVFREIDFDTNLYQGSAGDKVKLLQRFLKLEGFFNYEVSGVYDEKTKYSVNKYLTEKCDWDSSNQGIIGPLARECILTNLKKQLYGDEDEE